MGKCCNPYRRQHSKKQQGSTKPITDFDRCKQILPNFPWVAGQELCTRCRMRLLDDLKILEVHKAGVQMAQKKKASNTANKAALSQQDDDGDQSREDMSSPEGIPEENPASSASDDVTPSAPIAAGIYPPLPEGPCSSSQATARQLPYNPAVPTPTGSLVASSVTENTGSQESSDSSETQRRKVSETLNQKLKEINVTPTRPSDIKDTNLLRRRFQKFKTTATATFEKVTGVKSTPEDSKKRKCAFCSRLLNELAAKYKKQPTKADKYKVLTSIPKRFSIKEVEEAVGCTTYAAETASRLKFENGAFSWPFPKVGKKLDPNVVQKIIDFYNDDENSRASPNETILVMQESGAREPIAKRRIMHNLSDLYLSFKEQNPDVKVSLSKFSKLRPKNCVWPGLRGQHNTCICEIHQNFEFMLEAVDCHLSVAEFVPKVVCVGENLSVDCYLGMCPNCPRNEFLDELLKTLADDDAVTVNQWVHTDSTEMQTLTMSVELFRKTLMQYLPRIIEHEYITQKQKKFIRKLRLETIKETAAITVQVDFAQNYSFIIQNAVQGFHWNNKQATVHPFAVHFWNADEEIIDYKTFCVISDEMSHDADTFHVFRQAVMPEIISCLSPFSFKKIFYISDGCGGQYKNFKNFSNLMMHQTDFGIDAEWHFTSTSHGKGLCDAMSAVVKCSARRYSLKPKCYIRTPTEMFRYCDRHLTSDKLKFVYVSKETVAAQRPILEQRYQQFKTIHGTRKMHMFRPMPNGMISMGRTSDAETLHQIDFRNIEVTDFTAGNLKLGFFYAFVVGTNYQVGLLVEENNDDGDVKFQVLKLNKNTRKAVWPEEIVFVDVPYRDILKELEEPETDDGNTYEIKKDEMKAIRARANLYKAKHT